MATIHCPHCGGSVMVRRRDFAQNECLLKEYTLRRPTLESGEAGGHGRPGSVMQRFQDCNPDDEAAAGNSRKLPPGSGGGGAAIGMGLYDQCQIQFVQALLLKQLKHYDCLAWHVFQDPTWETCKRNCWRRVAERETPFSIN